MQYRILKQEMFTSKWEMLGESKTKHETKRTEDFDFKIDNAGTGEVRGSECSFLCRGSRFDSQPPH